MLLDNILHDLDGTPSSYSRATRLIEEGGFGEFGGSNELTPVNAAFLATFTIDLVRPFLVVESARRGMLVSPYFAPFNQLEQQVLDTGSQLYQGNPDVVVIAARLEELAPSLVERFASLNQEDVTAELAAVANRARGRGI